MAIGAGGKKRRRFQCEMNFYDRTFLFIEGRTILKELDDDGSFIFIHDGDDLW